MTQTQQRKPWRDPRIEEFDETVGQPSERVHVFVSEDDQQLHLEVIKADPSGVLQVISIRLDGPQTKQLANVLTAGEYQAWLRRGL